MNVFELFATLKVDDAQYKSSLSNAERRLKGFGDRAQRIGGTLTRSLSVPLTALGGGIIAASTNFQASMNRVQGITQATGEEFESLTSLARDLGETTQFSASQAADGMGFLAQAGFEVNEIMEALPGTLELAAAGQLSLAEAADLASNVLTGFGLEAEEIGRINDTLAKTATSTNTNVRQLGEAFSFVAPVAAGLGVSVEEAGAAMGVLSNAGIQGTRAGTGLRRVLTTLVNESDELGVAVTEADGSLRPFADIIADIEERGLSTAEALEIFGDRGGPAIATLLGEGSDAIRDLQTDLENAGGTAAQLADTQMQGLPGAFRELRSAIEGAAIGIGEAGLADLIEDVADMITNAVRGFNDLDDDTKNLIVTIGAFATALGPVVTALGFMATGLGALLTPIGLVVGALAFTVGGLGYALVSQTAAMGDFKQSTEDATESTQALAEQSDQVTLDNLDGELDKIATTLSGDVLEAFEGSRDQIKGLVEDAEDASVALARINLGASLAQSMQDMDGGLLGVSLEEALGVAGAQVFGERAITGAFEQIQTLLATGQLEEAFALIREVQGLLSQPASGNLADPAPLIGNGVLDQVNALEAELREALQVMNDLRTEASDPIDAPDGTLTGEPNVPEADSGEDDVTSGLDSQTTSVRNLTAAYESLQRVQTSLSDAERGVVDRLLASREGTTSYTQSLEDLRRKGAEATRGQQILADVYARSPEGIVATNQATLQYTQSLDELRARGAAAAQAQQNLTETVAISGEQMQNIVSGGMQQFVAGMTDLGVQAANTNATVAEAFALMAFNVVDSILQQIIALQVRLIAEKLFSAGTLNFVKLGAAVAASVAIKGLANSLKNRISSRSTAQAPASSGVPAATAASSPEANAVIDRLDASIERFGTYVERLVTEGIQVQLTGGGSGTAVLRGT